MELPLSRYQSTSVGQSQDGIRLSLPFSSDSKPSLFTGARFRINGRKLSNPFPQIRCSLLEQQLRPKPQLKSSEFQVGREEKQKFEETRVKKRSSRLRDQIEKLVFCRRYQEALELFEILEIEGDHQVTNSTYDALVNACIGLRSIRGARKRFLIMWSRSGDADSRTFATMIGATANLDLISPGKQLHSCVVKMGICDDIFVACALVNMYSRGGSIEDARFVFDEMPEKNTVAWNSIIAGYGLHGYSEEALSLYYDMQDAGVPMDHFTFSIVVRICARLGNLEHAKQAHAGLVRHGFSLDTVANTALVDLYGKWGRIDDARNVFDGMPRKNVISWNALIAGYGIHGRGEEAVELFEKMIREGMRPNHVTFLAVLSACCYSGLSDRGSEIFDSMSRVHHVTPRAMHYACMIELFGHEGRLDEALALIRDAPVKPTMNMWAALLTACRVHKNFKLGTFAAEKLYGMEPKKLSNYVVLLNIYYGQGKLDEAASVVCTLRRKGLEMSPACTWIEIKKQSYAFLANDNCNAQTKDIYEKLDDLLLQISKHGPTNKGYKLHGYGTLSSPSKYLISWVPHRARWAMTFDISGLLTEMHQIPFLTKLSQMILQVRVFEMLLLAYVIRTWLQLSNTSTSTDLDFAVSWESQALVENEGP
ncbi:hypothetical protein Cgig2_005602 [Carnegiea gigantea]|uniref:Pentatricopeptide repeat-containing protein n=1 Tax=Carnegiea gigantea TaxID=171969 RepID=A0A9Q1QRF6_9CARY|nr:hypothetical protein Cgig2_005602 [Carnegiea gigantea]